MQATEVEEARSLAARLAPGSTAGVGVGVFVGIVPGGAAAVPHGPRGSPESPVS